MAFIKKQAKQPEEPRKPDLVIRAKQSPESDFWQTIGAAWSFKDGKAGYSVKLHSIPTNWNGEFIMLPPKTDE